jgi:hypothetical protein
MNTIPQDVLYFINPVIPPVFPLPENAVIVVTEARDRNPEKLGAIMPVSNIWHDDLKVWYRGEDDNYYDGPMIGESVSRSEYAIDLIGDEAVFGYVNNNFTLNGGKSWSLSSTRFWSDQQMLINGMTVTEHYGKSMVPAAPWAADLWPRPNDSDDLRAAKIALAKHRWETQQKHVGIIREGQRRDWLYILEGKDFLREHGMQRPVYGALINGHVSLPVNQNIRLEELSPRGQRNLESLARYRNDTGEVFAAQVQVPVQFVYPGLSPYREGVNIHTVDASLVTSHFQQTSNNYEVTVSAQNVQPTITALHS